MQITFHLHKVEKTIMLAKIVKITPYDISDDIKVFVTVHRDFKSSEKSHRYALVSNAII